MVPAKGTATMNNCFEQFTETGGELKFPFSRQLVVDFYDGTFTSLVECAGCGRTYACFIIDSDKTLKTRIFTLRPIEPSALDRVTELFTRAAGAKPTEGYWCPHVPAEAGETIHREASEVLNSGGTPEWLIAANPYIDTIFAVKRVPNELVADVNASFFGITRS